MSPIKELKRMSASDRYVQVKTPIVMDSTRLVVPLDVSPGLRDLIGDHIYFTYDEPIATVPPQIFGHSGSCESCATRLGTRPGTEGTPLGSDFF
jgi:hypothetical protein